MAGNRSIAEIKFHNKETSIATGLEYMITSDGSEMNLDFMGTGTFKALVQGKVSYESDWDSVEVINRSDYTDMTTTPNTFSTYALDTTAWSYIRVQLTEMTDAEITVIGRLVG